MLAFADRTPGILAYVKGKAQHQQAVENAIRDGRPIPTDLDDANELIDAYNQVTQELESGRSTCPKCNGVLGATKTMNTDGRYYHPDCVRHW
jgi:hypothetical protein